MKRQALMILMTLSLLVMLTATSVHAQSGTEVVANIPFEFVIGNKAFPAGEYTIKYLDAYMMLIRSQDGSKRMFVITTKVEAKRTRCELVFNRYGDQYFLSKLWTAGDDVGRIVRISRSERELIRARTALAQSAAEPQIVSITLVASKR